MYSVDIYNRVRRACLKDGMSARAAALYFNKDRKTIAKMLRHELPPGYRRSEPPHRPTLDAYVVIIDEILRTDKALIKKQRHTAKRIFERLRDEHGYVGSLTTVTYYVRERKQRTKEVFVPLSHCPGHAQVDFGETLGVIGGVECKIHFFVMSLPHSDAVFVKGKRCVAPMVSEQCLL
jgi:transposase